METLNLGIDGLENIEQIAQGGSSRVFRAHQRELDRTVALKVLKSSDDPEVARRFDRERKAMGRLSHHDGIVPVYSTGVTERGEPYLVMPYYPRGSLQDRIEAGPVPWSEAVGYVSTAAMTMAAAHEMDVVHLDLKPANILLSSTGQPKIADFGIAKLMGDQVHSEDSGAIFTPTFTAPETLMGGQATAAADVYGLGVTLWAMIAGRPPFRAMDGEDNTLISIVGRVVHQPIGDLRSLAPDAVCRVIEVAAAKDPDTRYPTAGAFANALRNAVAEAGGAGSPSPATTATATMSPVAAAGGVGGAAAAATTPMHDAGLGEGLGAPAGAGPAPYDPALPGADAAAGLRFDAAVPPRLVPAPDARGATVSDVVDRYGGALLAVAVAVLVAVGAYAVLQLLGSPAPTALDTDAEVTSSSTTSTPQGALAGAGRSGSGSTAPAGPTTETTEESAAESTASTQSSTSATTVATSPTPAPTDPDPEPTDPEPTEPEPADPPPDPDPDPTPPTDPDPTDPPPDPDPDPTPPPDPDPDPTPPTDPDPTDPPDPDPLPTPTGLVEIEAQDGRIVIGWSAPATNPGRTGYEVLRSVDGGAPIVVGAIGPSRTRYQDTDVEAGSIYRYQIRALGPASGDPADSAPSASLTVDLSDLAPPDDGTPPDGDPPADPDGVAPD